MLLASLSGILFTANNFIINQTEVDVADVVLVRTIVQVLVYVPVILYREDNFLPASNTHKRYTIQYTRWKYFKVFPLQVIAFWVQVSAAQ